MKQLLFIFFAGLITIETQANQKILEYSFGNQITASNLTIYENGYISKQERSCCPPHTKQVIVPPADAETLSVINAAIADLPNYGTTSYESGATSMGSSAGYLKVFESANQEILVRSIERGEGYDSPRIVTVNLSPMVADLEAIVNGLVDEKMDHEPQP